MCLNVGVGGEGLHCLSQRLHVAEQGVVVVTAGIVDDFVDGFCAEIVGVRVAEAGNHAVGKEVLGQASDGCDECGNGVKEVNVGFAVEAVCECAEFAYGHGAVAGRFRPNGSRGVKSVGCQSFHAPLPKAVVMGDEGEVVLAAAAVGIARIVAEGKGDVGNEVGLDDVPVVVRNAIGCDAVCPFPQGVFAVAAFVVRHFVGEQTEGFCGFDDDVFVDDFEGCHADERLLMSVVEVVGDVAVEQTAKERAQHRQGNESGIAGVGCLAVEAGGIAGDLQDFAIDVADVAACF